MAKYRTTLYTRTGVKWGLLQGSSGSALSHGTVINGGGSASISPRLDLPLISGGNRSRLSSWASEIVIERVAGPGLLGPVFAGPVTKPHADLDSQTLTVTASPLWAWLQTERLITQPLTYGGWEQTAVAADLISRFTTGLGPAGDIRLGVVTLPTGVRVSQQYQPADQKTVGTAVGDLVAATNGFDFDITLARVGGKLTRTWQPYFPRKGRKVEQALTPGRGGLRNFSLEEATDIATRVTGVGQIQYTSQVPAAVEAAYGIHTRSISLVDARSVSLLQRQVIDYLAARTPPVDIVSFGYRITDRTPYGFTQTGDSVRVKAGKGWAEYDQWVRVIGQQTDVDTQGNEMVTCTAAGVAGGIS